jgi:hypothetical protein
MAEGKPGWGGDTLARQKLSCHLFGMFCSAAVGLRRTPASAQRKTSLPQVPSWLPESERRYPSARATFLLDAPLRTPFLAVCLRTQRHRSVRVSSIDFKNRATPVFQCKVWARVVLIADQSAASGRC